MEKLLLFAGTAEGRRLVETLAGIVDITACVATEYGKTLLPCSAHLRVLSGRLGCKEIAELLLTEQFNCVVDTTHPYATEVTRNVQAECAKADIPYFRLLRLPSEDNISLRVPNMEAAVASLDQMQGNILLTTGSKDLEQLSRIKQFKKRVFVRVLPMVEALEKCMSMGLSGKQIICMQGPFTAEMNAAMLQQTGASILVTKDSGDSGGFAEKLAGAEKVGAQVLVVGRPPEVHGCYFEELLEILQKRFGAFVALVDDSKCTDAPILSTDGNKCGYMNAKKEQETGQAYPCFPLYIPLNGETVKIFGAGKIAARRARALLPFGCHITLVAPEVCPELEILEKDGKVILLRRAYMDMDIVGCRVVVVATDDRAVNQRIGETCRTLGIPVSVADRREECTFYFPGLAVRGSVTAAVCAGGMDHALAKRVTHAVGDLLEDMTRKITAN